MGAASHLQETFTDAHVSVTSLLAELKPWAEQCSDTDRTKWLSKKVYRDALAARLQQVCTACKQAMNVKTAADRDGKVLQQLEALRCLISLIPQETGQQLAQHLLYKTNLLDSLSAMMELLPQLADLYTDHTADTDSSHNNVINQLVSTGRFVLAAVQDMANYTYPAVAAAPSQMGGSLASKNALVTGREACGPKLLKSLLLMTNMDTRVTCCYYSLRRSAVSLLRELVTCCRRNQRLLLQDYSAEYKQLMCEVLPSCGDQPTQADLFEVLYRCAKVFGEQVYQHCLGAQMRGQMAQLLAQDSADLDLSSELSKMVVAYNISLKDKASVMLVEAQMLRLSAPLLQPVGHQVPLGPHHISLPILLQQDDDEPEPEILDISYNNISRVIVTPAAAAQHPDLAQPGQQLVEMQCKTFPACLGEDVKRACEEAAAGGAGSIAAASRRDGDVFSLGMVLLDNQLNRLLKVLRAKDIIVKTHSPALQENSGIQSQGQTQRRKMSIGTMPSSYHKPPLHFSKSTPASSLHPRALTFTKSTAAAAAAGQQITPPLPLPPAAAGSGTARRQQPQPQTVEQLVSTTPLPAKSAAPGKDAAAATAAEAADDDSNAAAAAAAAMAAAFAPSPSKHSLLAASSDSPDSADSDDSKSESQSQSGLNARPKPAEKESLVTKSRKRSSRTVTGRVSLDSYEQMDFVAATAEDGDAQDAGDNPSAAAAAAGGGGASLQAVADEEDEAAVTGDTRSPQARSKETGPASPLIDLVAEGLPDQQQQQHARQQQLLRAATESPSLSFQQQQQQRQDEQQQADEDDVLQKVEKEQQQFDATELRLDGNSSENEQEQQDGDNDDDNSPATAGLQQLPLLPSSKQQIDTKAHKRHTTKKTAATAGDAAAAAATAVQQVQHKQIQQPLFSDVRKVHQRKGQQAPLQPLLHEPQQQQQQQQEHKQQQQVDGHTAADDQYMFSPEDDNENHQAGSSKSSSDQDSDYVAGRAKRAARGRRRTAGAAAGGSRPTSRLAGMKRKAAAAAAAAGGSTAADDGDIEEQQQQQRGGRGRGGKSARGSKAHNGTSRAARGTKAKADGNQHNQAEPDQQPKPRGRKRKQQQQQEEEDNAEVAAPQVSGGAAGAGGRVGLTAAQILAAAAPPSPFDDYNDAAHDDADDYLAGLAAASGPGLSDGGVIGFHADATAQPDYMPTPPESNIGGDVGVDQQQWMQTAANITNLQKAGNVQHQNTAATAMDVHGRFEHDMNQVLLTTNKLTLINTDQVTTATVTPAAAAAASKLPRLLPLGREQTSKRAALSRPASAADQAQLLSVTAAKDKKSRLSILGGGSRLADMPKLPTGLGAAAAAGGAGSRTKALNQRIIQQLLAAGDDSDDDDGCDSDAEGDDHDQVHATVSLGAPAYGLPGLNNSRNALQYMSASAEGGNAAAGGAGGGGGDAAMAMQLLMALKDEDDDNDSEEIAVLQAALARMLTAKRQQAQKRQQALIQEVQQAVFGRVNDLESALSAELQGLAAAGSARMSELSAGLKGKMQEINSVKDKFETELQSLWQQYAELHGQLTTVQEEVCRQSEDKRRAFKRKLAALHQEAGRVFEAAEKRLACSRPSTMGRHMPALAGLLRAG